MKGQTIAYAGAAAMAACFIGAACSNGGALAETPAAPAAPAYWTPLPQPGSERTGIWTACGSDGVRLWLAEGVAAAGPSITSQPDPTCRGPR